MVTPDGLGTDYATIERMIRHDPEALGLWTVATKGPQADEQERDEDGRFKSGVHNVNARPTGNSRKQALRRLDKLAAIDERATELRRLVLAGEKSPHGALVELGKRRPTITVSKDVKLAAATLRRAWVRRGCGCRGASAGRWQAPERTRAARLDLPPDGCTSAGGPGSRRPRPITGPHQPRARACRRLTRPVAGHDSRDRGTTVWLTLR